MWIAVFLKKKKKVQRKGEILFLSVQRYQMFRKCIGLGDDWNGLALPWLDNSGPNPSAPMQFQMISSMGAVLLRWHAWFRRAFPVTHLPFRKHAVLCEPVCMIPCWETNRCSEPGLSYPCQVSVKLDFTYWVYGTNCRAQRCLCMNR